MLNRRKFLSRFGVILGLGIAGSRANAKNQLSPEEIVKAWEDPTFRNSLSKSQWDALPPNPAGEIKNGQFKGDWLMASGNNCSGNNCSGNNCSGNNCSGNSCSGNNCSGNNCSGNNCSGNNCSGNSCSGNRC